VTDEIWARCCREDPKRGRFMEASKIFLRLLGRSLTSAREKQKNSTLVSLPLFSSASSLPRANKKTEQQPPAPAPAAPGPDYSWTSSTKRSLALELVRVTEAAALAGARHLGRGDKNAADKAAVDIMRRVLNTIPMDGVIVIGEGALRVCVREKGKREEEKRERKRRERGREKERERSVFFFF